jgi:hypothetical protein
MDLQVSFGVARDISKEPLAMACLLEKPISIAGRDVDSLEVEIFGYDSSLAPARTLQTGSIELQGLSQGSLEEDQDYQRTGKDQ